MLKITSRESPRFLRSFRFSFVLILFVLFPAGEASAQSSTDGTTPAALTPGAPAGSYPLSGFENVNLFNGNLNFSLPMLQVGGRGAAQSPLMLKFEQHWRIELASDGLYYPSNNWWTFLNPGYGPGVMQGRVATDGIQQCPLGEEYPRSSLLRLTFSASDGTEYEMRDQLTNGAPQVIVNQGIGCPPQQWVQRGTVFVTADGTAATFISCQPNGTLIPLYDFDTTGIGFYPSGILMLRDGTRYRIDTGLVSWMQDRNGNRISFQYEYVNINGEQVGRVTGTTDSLNRHVTVQYNVSDVQPYGLCDKITFKGFGGDPRIVRVSKDSMHNILRPPFQTRYLHDLFPEITGASSWTKYDDTKVSALWLPNGTSYKYLYNDYGELARVELPTGGAFEYDWAPGIENQTNSSVNGNIYRRVTERRVYPNGGNVAFENKTTYSRPESNNGTAIINSGYVLVTQYSSTPSVLSATKHYLEGYASYDPTTNPSAPFGRIYYLPWKWGKESKTEVLDPNDQTNILRRVEHNFEQREHVSWWPANQNLSGEPINDPRITYTLTTLSDVTPNLVSKQAFAYDQYNNLTATDEYDFGSGSPGSLVRSSTTSYVTTNGGVNYSTVNPDTTNPNPASTAHLRSLPLQQSVFDGPTGVEKSRTIYEYDHYNQVTSEDFHASLTNRSNITGLDGSSTTTYYPRGNVTKTTRAVFFGGNGDVASSVSGYAQYDIAGNVVKVIDPRSTINNIIATTFDFSDRYGSPDSEAESNTLPTELNTIPPVFTYAFATKATNALNQNAYIQYDYYLGKPVNSEDANGVVSSGRYGGFADGSYTDMLDRPTEVIVAANVSSLARRTRFTYTDSSHLIMIQSDQTTLNDGVLTSTVVYDGLGRTTETRIAAPEGTIYTKQEFDAMGRVKRSYNPYRTTSDETYGYADTGYDALGRVTTVTTSDTAVVGTTYSGNATTVTDQAGKKRRSVTDGLGRLIRIDEPDSSGNLDTGNPPQPLQPTSYGYDALGNLIQVNQGNQQRLFTYDSLSRLKTAKNPEQVNSSGQMVETTYGYDNVSNLLSKTGPNSGVSVSFTYDALNRVKTKTLSSGGTWDYTYDTATISNAKGRLVSVVLDGGTDGYYYDGYDAMGRVTASRQVTTAGSANTYTMSYEYDLVGNMTRQVYPSGKAFINEYDGAGRVAGVKKEGAGYYAGATPTDATNRIQYSAHGAVAAMKFGNQKWEHTLFNSRLQPTEIGLGTSKTDSSLLKLEYKYGMVVNNVLDTTQNNGNIQSQIITAPGLVLNQTYTYDKLNRLNDAIESGGTNEWSQTYSYDRYGNRAVAGTVLDAARTAPSLSAFDTATNRIKPSVMSGFGYDTSGNVTSDPYAANAIVYDAENHQSSYGASTYGYNGEGGRVKKQVGSTTTVFVYNVAGQLIAEYDNSTSPPPGSGASHLTSDHLGSTRAVMKADGTVARHDYLPFGEEIPSNIGGRSSVAGYGATDSTKQKFTQKERDSESGLDYFLARYYSSAQGRFTSPDEFTGGPHEFTASAASNPTFYADLHEPATLNKYQYCLNSPLRYVDPDGHQQGANLIEEAAREQQQQTANTLARAGLGIAAHLGRTGAQDGTLRLSYDAKAKALPRTEAGSAERNVLKAETRQKMSPLGQAISEAADKSRQGRTLTLEGANKPNVGFTQFGRAAQISGGLLLGAGVAVSAYNVATAPEGQKGQALIKEGSVWGGALAGGQVGAELGVVGGPWGILGGGIVGSIIGGITGGNVADNMLKPGRSPAEPTLGPRMIPTKEDRPRGPF